MQAQVVQAPHYIKYIAGFPYTAHAAIINSSNISEQTQLVAGGAVVHLRSDYLLELPGLS